MTLPEILQFSSVMIFSLSLSLSAWAFLKNTHSSRTTQTARLHEVWWSNEMMETRYQVFAICKDHAHGGPVAQALVDYYEEPLDVVPPEGYTPFAKLMGFFCNLEACMEAGILHDKLTCRLFGESHYKDYQPLIAAVRETIIDARKGGPLPLWLQQTVDLERRFAKQGLVFRPGLKKLHLAENTSG